MAKEHYERNNRPLKIAIDVSIWQFQVQSGRGGSNPALRTLYYRLLRLLGLAIHPLFVFDGPNKPPFKRNVKTHPQSASLPNYLTKQLLKFFGFPFHTAPGEAEAECAVLQMEGLVDTVLSEDVDTLMFGCSFALRNWSSEGTRGNKSPTHVSFYTTAATKEGPAGLDSDGMILVALMSGGDYIPAGVPRCGIKLACEAARAGFGRDLCRLSKKDSVGLRQWRERLRYELETNESAFFKVKHKAIRIPDTFPDMAVLGYYTNPVVSNAEKVLRLSSEIVWDTEIDIRGLRNFVAEAFEWHSLSGAKKFVRGLAPALLVHQLRRRSELQKTENSLEVQDNELNDIITAICGRRNNFITDGTPELRVVYLPNEIVGINLDLEEKDNTTIEDCSASDPDCLDHVESGAELQSRTKAVAKSKAKSVYDPEQPEKLWILEYFVNLGAPKLVQNWEEDMKNPKKSVSKKAKPQTTVSGARKQAVIDSYLKISKPVNAPRTTEDTNEVTRLVSGSSRILKHSAVTQSGSPSDNAKFHATDIEITTRKPRLREKIPTPKSVQNIRTPPTTPKKLDMSTSITTLDENPWTLSRRPSNTLGKVASTSRYSALGIYGSPSSMLSTRSPDNAIRGDLGAKNPPKNLSIIDLDASSPASDHSVSNLQVEGTFSCISRLHISSPELSQPTSSDSLMLPSARVSLQTSHMGRRGSFVSNLPRNTLSLSNEASKRRGQLVLLRQSLDGAWRNAEPCEVVGKSSNVVFEGVEFLDMTGD